MLGQPYQMDLIDDIFIFADKLDDKALVLYDYNNNKLINRSINIGQGPDEILTPIELGVNNSAKLINILQRQSGIYMQYSLTDLIMDSIRPVNKINFGDIDKIIETDTGYISAGFFENGSIGIYDKTGNLLKVENIYPEYLNKQTDITNKYLIGQGQISFNNNTRVFAFASYFTGEIKFYHLSSSNDFEQINYYDLNKSADLKNRTTENTDNAQIMQTDIEHSTDIFSTKEYFYVLYSGENMRDRHLAKHSFVFQFSSGGEAVNSFKTSCRLYNICVDENNKKIYGLALNKELDYIIVGMDI
jgi:hypothetical protein